MTATAAILVIGNEILSGKTPDANIQWLAQKLGTLGIRLTEVRIVRDEESAIVAAARALKSAFTYVFTTGGIGPTHDDITAVCIARACNLPLELDAEAERRLTTYYAARGQTVNAARLRMAHIPRGAALIDNPVSAAPGFRIENVHVMAGVPQIMQAMFDGISHTLSGGPPMISVTVTAALREGDIADELTAIQSAFPDVEIGSYPGMTDGKLCVRLVLTAQDPPRLAAAAEQVAALSRKWGQEPVVDG